MRYGDSYDHVYENNDKMSLSFMGYPHKNLPIEKLIINEGTDEMTVYCSIQIDEHYDKTYFEKTSIDFDMPVTRLLDEGHFVIRYYDKDNNDIYIAARKINSVTYSHECSDDECCIIIKASELIDPCKKDFPSQGFIKWNDSSGENMEWMSNMKVFVDYMQEYNDDCLDYVYGLVSFYVSLPAFDPRRINRLKSIFSKDNKSDELMDFYLYDSNHTPVYITEIRPRTDLCRHPEDLKRFDLPENIVEDVITDVPNASDKQITFGLVWAIVGDCQSEFFKVYLNTIKRDERYRLNYPNEKVDTNVDTSIDPERDDNKSYLNIYFPTDYNRLFDDSKYELYTFTLRERYVTGVGAITDHSERFKFDESNNSIELFKDLETKVDQYLTYIKGGIAFPLRFDFFTNYKDRDGIDQYKKETLYYFIEQKVRIEKYANPVFCILHARLATQKNSFNYVKPNLEKKEEHPHKFMNIYFPSDYDEHPTKPFTPYSVAIRRRKIDEKDPNKMIIEYDGIFNSVDYVNTMNTAIRHYMKYIRKGGNLFPILIEFTDLGIGTRSMYFYIDELDTVIFNKILQCTLVVKFCE